MKSEVEDLEKMETQLWTRHTTAARVLIDAGKPNASTSQLAGTIQKLR